MVMNKILIFLMLFLLFPEVYGNTSLKCQALAPNSGDLRSYDVLLYRIENEGLTELPFVFSEPVLERMISNAGFSLKPMEPAPQFQKKWVLLSGGERIGTIRAIHDFKKCKIYFYADDNKFKPEIRTLLKIICSQYREIHQRLLKELEIKRAKTEQSPRLAEVFSNHQKAFRQYPFLQTQIRGLEDINESLNLEIPLLVKMAYQKVMNSPGLPKPAHFEVLDVGCGKGSFLYELSQHVEDPEYRYTGISPEKAAIASAYKNAGISYFQAFAENLPQEWTGKFHFINFYQALYLAADPLRALEEIYRVLAPGGIAVIDMYGVVIYSNDNKKGDENWLYGKGADYIQASGIPVTSNGRTLVLHKDNLYKLPLSFPMDYVEPVYVPQTFANMRKRLLANKSAIPPGLKHLKGELTLHRAARYRTKPSIWDEYSPPQNPSLVDQEGIGPQDSSA
jgi:SAM-dependent methyltransferase